MQVRSIGPISFFWKIQNSEKKFFAIVKFKKYIKNAFLLCWYIKIDPRNEIIEKYLKVLNLKFYFFIFFFENSEKMIRMENSRNFRKRILALLINVNRFKKLKYEIKKSISENFESENSLFEEKLKKIWKMWFFLKSIYLFINSSIY